MYTPDGSRPKLRIKDTVIKYYIHRRATRPYYIFRIASVKMVQEWKNIVNNAIYNEELYPDILRGFFAGEGNIHEGKRSVRVIRISQKERKEFIDKILDYLGAIYSFTPSNRMYNLSNKRNWDIFARNRIADLHPRKKEKFWRLYNSYKEEHYYKNYLKNEVLQMLDKEMTAKELSIFFNRSQARVCDVLMMLKKEGKARNYRAGHVDYWTNKHDTIIISKTKMRYLDLLEKCKTTSELSNALKVSWWSGFKRLNELNKLGLVKRANDKKWQKIKSMKKIIVV